MECSAPTREERSAVWSCAGQPAQQGQGHHNNTKQTTFNQHPANFFPTQTTFKHLQTTFGSRHSGASRRPVRDLILPRCVLIPYTPSTHTPLHTHTPSTLTLHTHTPPHTPQPQTRGSESPRFQNRNRIHLTPYTSRQFVFQAPDQIIYNKTC